MSGDFAPFPLAVGFQDNQSATISFTNPAQNLTIPRWGNGCWWITPTPPECEPDLCQLGPDLCGGLPGGIELFEQALSLKSATINSGQAKVANPEDLDDIPPHLWPLIRQISQVAKNTNIDLEATDFKGVTITFHK